MKVSMTLAPWGLAICGATALLGAATPARADGMTLPPAAVVEGLVVAATDGGAGSPATLTLHSAIMGSSDTVVTLDAQTHFRKAGGELDTPDELPGGTALPAVQKPLPTWFVGLDARATIDPTSHDASLVFLSRPDPVFVAGTVESATDTDLVLNVPNRGKLDLTLDPQTTVRLDGLPSSGGKLGQGDLASALFWMTGTENEALRVIGRTPPPPPPLHFGGTLGAVVTDDGGTVVSFSVTRGTTTMNFVDSGKTQFSVDRKPATGADLKQGDYVSVLYQAGASENDALGVAAYSPKPVNDPPKPKPPQPEPPVPAPNPPGTGGATGGNGGGTSTPPSNGGGEKTPGPLGRLRAFEGTVGMVTATANTFTVNHGTTTQSFTVDAKTAFRLDGKPAAFTNLLPNEPVHVVYQETTSGNLALYVLIHSLAAPGGTDSPQP